MPSSEVRPRELVVNADDFGLTRDVNEGIVAAHCGGIVTATTLMANARAFDHAVELSRRTPTLDVGAHLVFVGGESLLTGRPQPVSFAGLAGMSWRIGDELYREGQAQLARICAAGIRPTHVDTHKHTHVLPPVFPVVLRLASEFQVPYVRLPFDTGWLPVRAIDRWYRGRVRRAGLHSTQNFVGFRLTGVLDGQSLARLLERLPAGATELMCHPGRLGPELRGAATRLKQSRELELAALTSPQIRHSLDRNGIALVNYRGLLASMPPRREAAPGAADAERLSGSGHSRTDRQASR